MYESVTHLVSQHTSIQERCDAAARLTDELRALDAPDLPLCIDTLDNSASIDYGALPERLVILQHGVVQFIGGKGPEDYSIDEARRALCALIGH